MESLDQFGHESAVTKFSTLVGSAPATAGAWQMDDASGPTLADTGTGGHPLTISGGVTKLSSGYGDGGSAFHFDGTGAATTASPALDTTQNLTVSAWVRLAALPTNDIVVAAQDGTDAAGFHLGVRIISGTVHWSFLMKNTSAQSSASIAAYSPTALTSADLNRWVARR